MLLSSFLTVAAALASQVYGYANPLACSGTCTNTHDPSIIRRASDGTYFRFATGGGIAIHKASSIQGPWTYQGYALASGSTIDNSGSDDMWAPDVHQIGDTYYMYYAVSAFGTQNSAIGVATSTTMEVGSWVDHGSSVGISSSSANTYNAIDPNLIQVGSTYYMNFGSFWGDIYQTVMTRPSVSGGHAANGIAYQPSGTHAVEGSYMIQYGSYFYLFYSAGICCNYDTTRPAPGAEYKVMVCRSTSATGGFVDATGQACTNGGETVVLASHGTVYGPGGQGVYNDPNLGWVLYYHYVDTTIGYADSQKRLGVNKITWTNGWPTV